MKKSERSQPLKDPQEITFIMIIIFWSLSKKPFIFLFLTDNIKLDGIPTKVKLKIQARFAMYFQFREGTSVACDKMQLPVL